MNRTAERPEDVLHQSSRKQKSVAGSLPDYVRRLRHERNLSLAVVSARSRGKIGKTHINRIENGLVSSVSLIKLRALALGLGVPDDEIIAVAQGKFPDIGAEADEARLLIYYRQLSRERQLDVLEMLRALANRSSQ
jgi:transcriptional regulator with XRE-family HTH domain